MEYEGFYNEMAQWKEDKQWIMAIYPHTVPIAKQTVKEQLQKLKKDLFILGKNKDEAKKVAFHSGNTVEQIELIELCIHLLADTFEKERIVRKEFNWCQKYLNFSFTSKKRQKDVSEVKIIPITNFIEFNRAGFAPCIWHEEKTPSMKYYSRTNTVYCFGCAEGGDVVDVFMKLQGVSFNEAIKML